MSIKRAALIVLLVLMAAVLLLSMRQTPGIYEYNILSPRAEKQEENADQPGEGEAGEQKPEGEKQSALKALLEGLEGKAEDLEGVMSSFGVVAYAPGSSLTETGEEKASKTALLKGVWGARLHHEEPLIAGRQLYLEEIRRGIPSAVIDEWLAINLFRVGDPIGRKLRVGELDLTVVGVVKHGRNVGERESGSVTAPLLALDKAGVQTGMMSVVMMPKPGAGAYAALSQAMEKWQPGGDFYSLPKEMYRVKLPLRLLMCAAGAMTVAVTLKLAGLATRRLWEGGRRRLQSRYAVHILPDLLGRGMLIFLMYALNAAAIALIFEAVIAPVYMFPEWVPGRLVDPGKIVETFWTLRAQETGLISLRTPELLRLKYLHRLMGLCCGGIFFLLLRPYYLWKNRVFRGK